MRLLFLLLPLVTFQGLHRTDAETGGISKACEYRIDTTIMSAIADTVLPGAVVAVVRNDKLAFLKSYGSQCVYPFYEPASDSTIYDLASLSKPVSTAISALQLVECGLLNLDTPVSSYLPDFAPYDKMEGRGKNRKRVVKQITVRQLMLHTSGLASYASYKKISEEYGGDILNYLCNGAPRRYRPGNRTRYSCLNYITLQLIIEKITGERLCDYAKENIFDVLGMADTRYFPGGAPDSLLRRIAPTEVLPDSIAVPRGVVHDPLARETMGGNSGNAGVFSTAGDLAVLCAALMNGGRLFLQEDGYLTAGPDGERREILGGAFTRSMFAVDRYAKRTCGWDSCTPNAEFCGCFYERSGVICHTGFTGSSIIIDSSTKTAIIFLNNRVHPYDRGKIKYPHKNLKDVRIAIADAVAADVL